MYVLIELMTSDIWCTCNVPFFVCIFYECVFLYYVLCLILYYGSVNMCANNEVSRAVLCCMTHFSQPFIMKQKPYRHMI